MNDEFIISTEQDLEAILGQAHAFVKEKICDTLDDAMKTFIERSPLVFVSTIDSRGQLDISPKGDAPGFVLTDNEDNLLIPERPGNKLALGFKNLLNNDHIGLIFVAPNMRETLRVKGTARISNDPALLQSLSAKGKPAILCTAVSVDECFFHCGKAMIRSKLWVPDSWQSYDDSLMARQVSKKLNADTDDNFEKEIIKEIEKNYREELY